MVKVNIEEKLLNSEKVEKAIGEVIKEEIAEARKPKQEIVITDIKEVPKGKIFSHNTAFNVFNRVNKTENSMNGIQTDSLLGLNKQKRKQLEAGEISEVTIGDYHIEFVEYRK